MEDSSTSPIPYAPRLWTAKFKLFEDALHDPAPRVRQMNACDWELAADVSDGLHVDLVPPSPIQPMIVPPPRGAGRDAPSLEVEIGLDNAHFFSRQPCANRAESADGFDSGSEPESEDEDRFENESDAISEGIVECNSDYGEADPDGGDVSSERGSGADGSHLDSAEESDSEFDEFARNWGTAARVDSGEHDMDDGMQQSEGAAGFFDKPHPWIGESSVPVPSGSPPPNATSTTTPGRPRARSQEVTATDGALREHASTYITRAEFDAFLELALPPVNLACPVSDCASQVSRLRYLKRHLETHLAPAEREQHRCHRCGRNLARRDSLRRHLNMTQDCTVAR